MAELKAVAIAYEQERATVAELIDAVAAALVEHGPAAENELSLELRLRLAEFGRGDIDEATLRGEIADVLGMTFRYGKVSAVFTTSSTFTRTRSPFVSVGSRRAAELV